MPDGVIEELIDELEANRSMFQALCLAVEGAFGEPVPGGSWSVGDHVAHVASYDQVARDQLAPSLLPMVLLPRENVDEWNETEVRTRSGRSRASLVGEMEERRSECLALLRALPAPELRRAVWFPGEARRSAGNVPLRLWLERWSKHDMVHARAILQGAPSLGPESDFENWLRDDPVLEALARTDGRTRARDRDRSGDPDQES